MVARSRGGGNLGDARGSISIDTAGAQRGVEALGRGLQNFARTADGMNRSLSGIGRGMTGLTRSLGGIQSAAATASRSFAAIEHSAGRMANSVSLAGAAIVGALSAVAIERTAKATIGAAADIEQAVRNIASIRPDVNLDTAFRSLQEISTRVPQTAEQLADGLYNIFSSIEVSFEDGLSLLENFSKGAIAAQTDAQTFGTAILGVLNAYKLSVADTGRVQDAFFNTVNRGVVTGQQLASSLGVVTASAKAAGASYDELFAAIVAVTKEGGEAAQNINNLANLFNKIITKDAVEELAALGVATADARGNIRPILDVMEDFGRALDRLRLSQGEAAAAAALQAIFPDAQARQGAQVLISQLGAARAALAENRDAAGSAERAFQTMVQSFNNQARLLKNNAVAILTDIGLVALPTATLAVQRLTTFLQGVRAILPDTGQALGQAFSRLRDGGADVGKLQGVLNAVFGEGSGVARGITAFIDATRGLGGIAATNIKAFADALGLTSAPVKGLLDGLGELGRTIGAEIDKLFNPQQARKAGEWADATTQIAEASERALTPVDRFLRLMDDLNARIQANPQIRALASAFDSLWEAGGRLLGAVRDLALVFLRPFIPTDAAGDVNGLLAALGKLGEGSAADKARTILDLLGKAAQAVADGLRNIAGFVDGAATGIQNLAQRLDQSGAITAVAEALGRVQAAAGPLVETLGKLVGFNLDKLFGGLTRGRRAETLPVGLPPQLVSELGGDVDAVETSANVLIGILGRIADAANAIAGGMKALDSSLQDLDKRMRETGQDKQLQGQFDDLGNSLKNLINAPFAGIAAGLRDVNASAAGDDVERMSKGLNLLGGAAFLAARFVDILRGVIERVAFVGGRFFAALERATSGDLAGAVTEMGAALQALRFVKGPGIDENLIMSPDTFENVKKEFQEVFDFINSVSAAPDRFLRGKANIPFTVDIAAAQQDVAKLKGDINTVPVKWETLFNPITGAFEGQVARQVKASIDSVPTDHATVFTADDTTFAASVARIQAAIASVPKRFTVSGDLDTSGVEDGVRRVGNLIPRSPAKEGPLSHVPDWQYLLANLPDVMGQMVDVVTAAGKRIGAGAQVEAFQNLAAAISAGAGAVKATIDSVSGLTEFTRPNAEALDEVAAAMRAVLTRLLALGRGFGEQAAEQVQRVAGAASAAVGALGATIDTISKARGFTGPNVAEVQDALDHMIFLVGRLSEMGAQFTGQQIGRVGAIGEAARSAMEALGAAVTAALSVRGFEGPSIDEVQDALNHMVFLVGRLETMAVQFSGEQLARVERVAGAAGAAMQALGEAVTGASAARGFRGPSVDAVQDALNHIVFLLGRLGDMGAQFSAGQMGRVETLAGAAGAAMSALGEAVAALTQARGFRGPAAGQIDAILGLIERLLDRLASVEARFSPEQVGRIEALGGAVSSAFGGLGAALAPLRELRGFVAPAAAEVEAAFRELARVAGRFRDLAATYSAEQTDAVERLGGATQAGFGALAAALDVLPRLAETTIPNVEAALVRLGEGIRAALAELVRLSATVGDDAAAEAARFAENAGAAIKLVADGVDAFARLPGLGEVSRGQIARFGAGVQLAIAELARLARELSGALTRQAVEVAENISKALGVLGAAASLQDLNEFVAPSDRQIRNFVNALLATVDRLIEATRGVEPEVARRTGEIGESIAAAMGGLGAGVAALADIADFDGGKGFETKLRGVIGLVGTAIATMRGLAGVVGDGGQLTGIAGGIAAVSNALGAFLGIAGSEDAAGQIEAMRRVAEAVAGIPGGLLILRHEVAFAATVNVNVHATGDGAANQAAAGEVAPATAEALKAEIWQAVANSLAFRGRF